MKLADQRSVKEVQPVSNSQTSAFIRPSIHPGRRLLRLQRVDVPWAVLGAAQRDSVRQSSGLQQRTGQYKQAEHSHLFSPLSKQTLAGCSAC